MARTDSGARFAMEVLVEQDVVAPVFAAPGSPTLAVGMTHRLFDPQVKHG